jgi:GTP-binding protein
MSPIIAIVGRPNVGKSTLFNRLKRSRDALVADRPGVTRDRLEAAITHDGVSFTLVDTGGFHDMGEDPLLASIKDQIEKAIAEADSIIFMVDGSDGLMPGDQEIADTLRRSQKKIFLAVNKVDGPEHEHSISDFYGLGVEPIYPISAAHGYGVKIFLKDLVKVLPQSQTVRKNRDEIRVAVLGKPNVGKSSLINRILCADRLLVSDVPGTTRDAVDTRFTYRNNAYLLIDTAGLRRKARVKESIDKFSMIKARKSIKRCHVAVVLLDGDAGISDQDARICGYTLEQPKGLVLAVNKWDLIKGNRRKINSLVQDMDRQLGFASFAPRLNLSALTGERVLKLFDNIDGVYEQFSRKFSTSSVNKALRETIEKHPPPKINRGRLKFFYATQVRSKPPTFLIFVNRPDRVHFSYERFLVNQLRQRLRLDSAPLRLDFRKKVKTVVKGT